MRASCIASRGTACALAFAALAPVARAAEVEYAALHRTLEPARAMAGFARLRAVQRIESKLPGVEPAAITIAIRGRAGRIEVPVAEDGTLALPVDAETLAENPVVETNQPAGSLTLTVSMELPKPRSSRMACAEIEAALADADRLLEQQGADARVRGVEFVLPADAGAVTLRGDGDAERVLVPDAEGRVIVMRDPELRRLYREIELPATPLRVLPFLDR
jgi:hypothetical protein